MVDDEDVWKGSKQAGNQAPPELPNQVVTTPEVPKPNQPAAPAESQVPASSGDVTMEVANQGEETPPQPAES